MVFNNFLCLPVLRVCGSFLDFDTSDLLVKPLFSWDMHKMIFQAHSKQILSLAVRHSYTITLLLQDAHK